MNNINNEFENKGMGRCVVLKDSNTPYSLIYSITCNQFIIVSYLDLSIGNWLHGSYFGTDIDDALDSFNQRIKKDYER